MSQTDLLVLARQGNVEAIATLMNRKLAPVQVMVEAQLEGQCLLLQLVGHRELPPQETLVTFIRRGMGILKVRQITAVQVSAWQAGATQPLWIDWLGLGDDLPEQSSAQEAVEAPPGQKFGVNLARPAAAAAAGSVLPNNGPRVIATPPSTSPALPTLGETIPDNSGGDVSAVAPAPAWDSIADPEQEYRTWMTQTGQLSWWYRWQIPKLAAFLVYFLRPAEVPLDVTGVFYQGHRCVLLLTDQRLSCLGGRGWQQTVQVYFSMPLATLTARPQPGVTVMAQGIHLDLPTQGLNYFVSWEQPGQGQHFIQRSLRRVVPIQMADEAGEYPPSSNGGEAASLAVWTGGGGLGDRFSFWFYGLLCLITLGVLVLVFLAAP